MGATIEVKLPEAVQYVDGTVTRITDASIYTVGKPLLLSKLLNVEHIK